MRVATDEQIRPVVAQGFAAISDGFNYAIDDVVDGFGEVLITQIRSFSENVAAYVSNLDKEKKEDRYKMQLLNKKSAKFADSIRKIKAAFDDAITEVEDALEHGVQNSDA